jgi:hypothetical protein
MTGRLNDGHDWHGKDRLWCHEDARHDMDRRENDLSVCPRGREAGEQCQNCE